MEQIWPMAIANGGVAIRRFCHFYLLRLPNMTDGDSDSQLVKMLLDLEQPLWNIFCLQSIHEVFAE